MKSPVIITLSLALAAGVPGLAAPQLDLDRVTPVPADQPIPTQDFFRPRVLTQPTLNRAGTHIAAVITAGEDKHQLYIHDIANEKFEVLGDGGAREIYNVSWLNDSRVIFHVASRKMYGLGLLAANVGNLDRAYPVRQYSGSSLVSIPLKNPLFPLVWNRYDFETGFDEGVAIINTNITTGTMVDLTAAGRSSGSYSAVLDQNLKTFKSNYPKPTGSALTYGYMTDKEGELAYCFRSDQGNLSLLRLEGGKWVPCPVDLEEIDVLGNANEPGQLLVRARANDGKPMPLRFMEAATGKLGDVVLQDAAYDFNGWLYYNRPTGDVLGASFHKSGPRMVWFNEQYAALQKILDDMFPKQVVRIRSNDDKHQVFLVATSSDTHPESYHWVNLQTRKAGIFRNSAPWIDPQRMQPMKILSFKTRDGHKLDAYLTLPAGASKENPPPLVVLCHGGPWARDLWGFDGQVQFLAHHGYAVLQPNYRGSTGSVGRFPADDEYDFIKMHHDVTDAVKTVAASGIVDKNRIGIMGGSFGGYLAVSGVAHEPGMYRCAVTNAGVFDWALQLQAQKFNQYDAPSYGRMIKKLGDPKRDVAKYEAMSPIRHVANIRAPVFVAGGKDDQVVEIQQSRKLINALEQHKVPHEKYFAGGEGHGMAFLKNEVELQDLVLAFLDKNLKAAP
jgi:dipeptidyl aminopeptidase/acylaminoacyl peptidase